jgi:hypothetical protein
LSRRVVSLLLACTLACGVDAFAQPMAEQRSCPISPLVRDTAPRDRGADPVVDSDWYINADRTIWAGPLPAGGWPSGGTLYSGSGTVKGQKTYWVRPQGTSLLITGRRVDAAAPALEAHVPCCYRSGFQIVALFFPTEGCWEVSASAGESELRFVTQVRPGADR